MIRYYYSHKRYIRFFGTKGVEVARMLVYDIPLMRIPVLKLFVGTCRLGNGNLSKYWKFGTELDQRKDTRQ